MRELGLLDGIMMGAGGMVGAAIFAYSGLTVSEAGYGALLSWGLAAALMATIAILYSELALRHPEEGAVALFPYRAFGGRVGAFLSVLEGLGYYLGCLIGIAVSAIVMPQILGFGHWVPQLAILASTAIALAGIRPASRANLAMSLFMMAALAALASVEVAKGGARQVLDLARGVELVPVAMLGYGAWTAIVSAAGAFSDPRRTVPRAVLASIALTAAFYLLVVAGVARTVPPGEVGLGAIAEAAGAALGRWARGLVASIAVVSILTTMLVLNLASALALSALAEHGALPGALRRSFRGSPTIPVAVTGLLALLFSSRPDLFYALTLVGAIAGTGLPYLVNVLAHMREFSGGRSPILGRARIPVSALSLLALVLLEANLGLEEAWGSAAALLALVLLSWILSRRWRHDTCPSSPSQPSS